MTRHGRQLAFPPSHMPVVSRPPCLVATVVLITRDWLCWRGSPFKLALFVARPLAFLPTAHFCQATQTTKLASTCLAEGKVRLD